MLQHAEERRLTSSMAKKMDTKMSDHVNDL